MNLIARWFAASLVGAATLLPVPAAAQDVYPSRPIRIIVPYSPGAAADSAGRVVADKLSAAFGQSVVVENRAGANGALGMQAAATSKPDGYTLVVAPSSAMSAAMALSASLPYHPVKDFAPIGLISTAPIALGVGKDHPANTIQEFVAMAKARPGTMSYGSSGGLLELAAEALKQKAGINLLGVSYKGPTEASVDVMSGRVDVLSSGLSSQIPLVNGGKMKTLAVLSPTRSPKLPNVPTMVESGFKDFQIVGWNGFFAPAGTPPAVVTRLNTELNKLLQLPDVKKQFDTLGFDIVPVTSAQFVTYLGDDVARLEAIAKAAGIVKK
ncbi:Bug family tripartite tricarboxylate transporter substrate binding protein [Ramlibacter sp.]|uniref:Bug family tripartite tricarboxylate transporter substrate binding protein n=1 Tax=Ramlibacter sp. TaxID=1917967 RepID=UPI003D1446DC